MSEEFSSWIGRNVTREDVVTSRLLAEYRATMAPHLFSPQDPSECPPGLHWGLAPATPGSDETGPDGAEAKGLFLPPIPLPRRMWAGGVIETLKPIRVGERVTRRSEIADLKMKSSAGGDLCIVSIRHDISGEDGLALHERQDLVFREPATSRVETGAEKVIEADWHVEASPLLLFRFSAFTFNGHRIHYDPYYAAEEGYPALLVHGPLQATLMLNLAATLLGAIPHRFEYRCLAPLFSGASFGVAYDGTASPATVRVIRSDGVTTAEGRVHARGTG